VGVNSHWARIEASISLQLISLIALTEKSIASMFFLTSEQFAGV